MKDTTIARNYAEALFLAGLAHQDGALERYADLLTAVSGAIESDPRIALALESPRVSKAVKANVLAQALADVAPAEFVRFLQSVVRRGRQSLLGAIAQAYDVLLDVKRNRVRAAITLIAEPDERLEQQITERLAKVLGSDVRATFRSDKRILGGIVVRVGDRIFDGSLRRKLATLRRHMVLDE